MCGIAAIYRRNLRPKDRPELDSAVTTMLASINHRGGVFVGVFPVPGKVDMDVENLHCSTR